MQYLKQDQWALILGGSSGFGLAAAKKLGESGMNICVVHRDRRGSMLRVEKEFEEIRRLGVKFLSFNTDALSGDGINLVLEGLKSVVDASRVRLLLHSIAFGNLKLIAKQKKKKASSASSVLASKLGLSESDTRTALNEIFAEGDDRFSALAESPEYDSDLLLEDEDVARTIYAMGTSFLTWTREIFNRNLFSQDARVLGLTSAGNQKAWLGYAAVSAAKAALESVSRSIAMEFGTYGIRSNIIQAGVSDTPALRLIPGGTRLLAQARLKNPLGRATEPEDVANVIALLATDEAAWINGSIICVDGGERIVG